MFFCKNRDFFMICILQNTSERLHLIIYAFWSTLEKTENNGKYFESILTIRTWYIFQNMLLLCILLHGISTSENCIDLNRSQCKVSLLPIFLFSGTNTEIYSQQYLNFRILSVNKKYGNEKLCSWTWFAQDRKSSEMVKQKM